VTSYWCCAEGFYLTISRPAPVNLADDGAWCLAGAVPGTRLIAEPWLLLWTDGCDAGRADIDRLSALLGWHCGAATQCASVDAGMCGNVM